MELTSEWKDGWLLGQYTYTCAVGLSKRKHMLNCYVISQTAALVSLLVSPFVSESASTLDMEDVPEGAGSSRTTEASVSPKGSSGMTLDRASLEAIN